MFFAGRGGVQGDVEREKKRATQITMKCFPRGGGEM